SSTACLRSNGAGLPADGVPRVVISGSAFRGIAGFPFSWLPLPAEPSSAAEAVPICNCVDVAMLARLNVIKQRKAVVAFMTHASTFDVKEQAHYRRCALCPIFGYAITLLFMDRTVNAVSSQLWLED
ncbi:MAG TPA: hypothetical protein VH681_00655, partial [Nitrospiraceae bacterium]